MGSKRTASEPDHVPVAYTVTGIEKTAAPDGQDGGWYRYVIENTRSRITGVRRGTKQQVLGYAESFAEDLNARASGRGQSIWAPKSKK
jgi:hypothetical protein